MGMTTTDAAPIIKLAVLAVGGQGGGVLANWIVALAEANGWQAQSTSVAGVAQRTGATIYYVEMTPDRGRPPIFALSPAPGDVDVLIAAELMEAGRAIMRGFVTPDRTTLIASTHRILAVSEKIEPGDGLRDPAAVHDAAERSAARHVAFDMEKMAKSVGSVVSASLFGALGGSGALPFPRESYEHAIRASGRGVEASLAAFDAAWRRAEAPADAPEDAPAATPEDAPADAPTLSAPRGPKRLLAAWTPLAARRDALPPPARAIADAGLRKTIDFLDIAYGAEYLDRVEAALELDDAELGWRLTAAAAKHVANAMCYDDPIRVADVKTRGRRRGEIRRELQVDDATIVRVTEYLHPRLAEALECLPAGLAGWVERRPRLYRWIDRRVDRGRRIRTDGLFGYLSLWIVGGMRPFRRRLKRHGHETRALDAWYARALTVASEDYDLAIETLNARRLIKGYSDTHARGTGKFDRIMAGLALIEGRADAADWMRRLIAAALSDEKGEALDGALKTIESFAAAAPPASGAGADAPAPAGALDAAYSASPRTNASLQ